MGPVMGKWTTLRKVPENKVLLGPRCPSCGQGSPEFGHYLTAIFIQDIGIELDHLQSEHKKTGCFPPQDEVDRILPQEFKFYKPRNQGQTHRWDSQ